MRTIKKPKTEHQSVTLRNCDRSRYVMLGFAFLVILGCIGFEFLPERYQGGVIAGLGSAVVLLSKLGFDFTGIVKDERRMLGDTESAVGKVGADPGLGHYVVAMTQDEYDAAIAQRVRRPDPNYEPEV